MRRECKKGLSPVIATAFLVMFVLILAAIVFMWARGFIQEQVNKGGQLAEDVCKAIDFDATFTRTNSAASNQVEGILSIINRGNYPIYGFELKGIKGGTSKKVTYNFAVNPGETIPAQPIVISGTPEAIVIYPRILGSVEKKNINREVTCVDNGVKKTL